MNAKQGTGEPAPEAAPHICGKLATGANSREDNPATPETSGRMSFGVEAAIRRQEDRKSRVRNGEIEPLLQILDSTIQRPHRGRKERTTRRVIHCRKASSMEASCKADLDEGNDWTWLESRRPRGDLVGKRADFRIRHRTSACALNEPADLEISPAPTQKEEIFAAPLLQCTLFLTT